MNERYPAATGARAGSLVDQLITATPALFEGATEIGDTVAYVVDSWTTFREELGDRAIPCHRLHQLDLQIVQVQGNN